MDAPPESAKKAGMAQRIALLGYKLLCGLLSITDVRIVAIFGRALGYLVWMASPSRRRIVARNMRIVVNPMLRADKLRTMVHRNIVRTTMNLVCSLKTGIMSDREMQRSISVVDGKIFAADGTNGRTAIGCVPHAGNWEILARIRPLFSEIEHYSCMYRKLSNPLLEDYVYRTRTRHGCSMHSKEDGLKTVLKLARTGGLLGVLSDQFTQEGIFIPYFGKVTGTTPLPALLYKRCKGKGSLYAVYTANTALGKWEAIMNFRIDIPEGSDSVEEITMRVNQALEECQRKNVLDGFWMHHRWKCTSEFAPANAFQNDIIRRHACLPFRAIVCVPEAFEEAVLLVPQLRMLKASRIDMQITIVCPEEQQAYWQKQNELVTYTATTDGRVSLAAQLDSDELYKDGPFDILFMFSENPRVMKNFADIMPVFTVTFDANPLARKFRFRRKYPQSARISKLHKAREYTAQAIIHHELSEPADMLAPGQGNTQASGNFIAPFSSLGSADSWEEEKWNELVRQLGGATLLALPQDEARAATLAEKLGCSLCISKPEDVCEHLGPNCKLYAVDGLLPALAAQAGATCTVLMASRLPQRYAPILGTGHRCLNNHVPCHPCHKADCDQPATCTTGISVANMLGN